MLSNIQQFVIRYQIEFYLSISIDTTTVLMKGWIHCLITFVNDVHMRIKTQWGSRVGQLLKHWLIVTLKPTSGAPS